MKTLEQIDDSDAWNVIASAQKHQDHMLYLLADYGSSCVAFGRAMQRDVGSANEYRRMIDAHKQIEETLASLVVQARRYFHGRISEDHERCALGPAWRPLRDMGT